mgnify:CR=1 FL=1
MKTGLKFYTIDTDRYQDRRIKRLKKDFGCQGIAVYDYILCEIYRVRGCVLEWDENTAFDVAEYFGLKESLVAEIVRYCGSVGLFDKELLAGGIVTSATILRRYLEMSKRAKRTNIEIPDELHKFREEIEELREETPKLREVLIQSKVKYNNKKEEDKTREAEIPEGTMVPIRTLCSVMLQDREWVDRVATNLKLTAEFIESSVQEFCQKEEVEGVNSREIGDARRHFMRWFKLKIERSKNGIRPLNYYSKGGNRNNTAIDLDELDRAIATGIAVGSTRQEWEL